MRLLARSLARSAKKQQDKQAAAWPSSINSGRLEFVCLLGAKLMDHCGRQPNMLADDRFRSLFNSIGLFGAQTCANLPPPDRWQLASEAGVARAASSSSFAAALRPLIGHSSACHIHAQVARARRSRLANSNSRVGLVCPSLESRGLSTSVFAGEDCATIGQRLIGSERVKERAREGNFRQRVGVNLHRKMISRPDESSWPLDERNNNGQPDGRR